MVSKPNILFLQVDQLAAAYLGAYGNRICHAPSLDLLARDGVVFENAYCNFPLCAPSRFSMATGQLASKVGAYDNAAEFSSSIPTYAHHLRELGYQTSLSGKMHFIGPDQYHGFETRLTADLYPADFSWAPNWADEGIRDTNDPRGVIISGVCERSVQIDYDEEVTHKAVQHIYDLARSDDDRPFFLQVSYTHPHEPYLCRKEFWHLYENAEIPMPSVGALLPNMHDAHSRRLLIDFGMLDFSFSDADIRRARRAYYGSISYIDQLVGRVLEALKATGADQNTAIIFTSDHGEMLGERGMWFKKHFFEPSMRIPLILSAPWIEPQRVSELCSLVDLLPSFNGLALGHPWESDDADLDGIDLTGLLGDKSLSSPRSVYAEYLAEATASPIFMIRRGRYKFISSKDDPDLLFDLDADPNECVNLASDPDYREIVEAFLDELADVWDASELTQRIRQSQKRRLRVRNAMKNGQPATWNHDEKPGDQVLWYRGKGSYNEWAFNYIPPVDDNVSPEGEPTQQRRRQ
ncbi:MAG: choline-sulfatase [Pseudomonadota bacterium]